MHKARPRLFVECMRAKSPGVTPLHLVATEYDADHALSEIAARSHQCGGIGPPGCTL